MRSLILITMLLISPLCNAIDLSIAIEDQDLCKECSNWIGGKIELSQTLAKTEIGDFGVSGSLNMRSKKTVSLFYSNSLTQNLSFSIGAGIQSSTIEWKIKQDAICCEESGFAPVFDGPGPGAVIVDYTPYLTNDVQRRSFKYKEKYEGNFIELKLAYKPFYISYAVSESETYDYSSVDDIDYVFIPNPSPFGRPIMDGYEDTKSIKTIKVNPKYLTVGVTIEF